MSIQTYRRIFGTAFGAALGLVFGVTSQIINSVNMPDLVFHQPPLGLWGNLLGAVLVGGLIGLLVSWWNASLGSIIVSAMIMALGVELVGTLYGTARSSEEIGPLILTVMVLWLPMTGLLGAIFSMLRWIINKHVEQWRDHASLFRRALLPAVALIVMGFIGTAAIYPAEGQQRVVEMNALIKAGLQTSARDSLPPALTVVAKPFQQHAAPGYTLQWIKGDGMLPWRIAQPGGHQLWEFSIVAARFPDGWVLACQFIAGADQPRCQSYERDPTVQYAPAP